MAEKITFMKRTRKCGELRADHIAQEIVLNGWVNRRRDHGGLIFIDLRDRYGLVQCVFDPQHAPEAHALAEGLRAEFVISVRGTVAMRPVGTENPDLPTGQIDVRVHEAEILNPAKTPPFGIAEYVDTDELIRMKYRYLDLRREKMQQNLVIRDRAAQATRQFMSAEGFLEVETPMMFKPTPEGARDYLVPSRLTPGSFYALPQSPQLLKQLLMVSGIDRYYQIARCMRDEDLRADRQPEFTQIDIEMSFVERDDVLDVCERLFQHIWRETIGYELPPFPRMTYAETIAKYGTDKPDTRFGLEFVDISDIAGEVEFKVFRGTVDRGGQVKGINVKGAAAYSRAQLDKLTEFAKEHKAQGLAWMRVQETGVDSPIAKFFTPAQIDKILAAFKAAPGDLLLFVADTPAIVAESLDWVRREMARQLDLIPEGAFAPLWVVDFPLFAWNEDEKRWDAEHHPFCMLHPDDWELLDTDPGKVRAASYDVVINGYELCSGSIRIHRRDIQEKIFGVLGISMEDAMEKFGFLLQAFEYGAPPHGGIAPGFDRIVMLLCGEDNIREVIAFPKTQRAQDLMSGAPAPADAKQLKELHIRLDLPVAPAE
jgi:aspartyl-tRNA synthetase